MYTKGEWKVEGERTIVGKDRELIMGLPVGGEIIATVNNKANAHLIAQGPRMYEWLREVISQGIISPTRNKNVYNEAVEIAAKVEGK